MSDASTAVDFDMAEEFLRVARAAHQAENETQFIAARKMVTVALGLSSQLSEDITKKIFRK